MLGDAIGGLKHAFDRAVKKSLRQPLADLSEAWIIYEQASAKEHDEVFAACNGKLPRYMYLTDPVPAWTIFHLLRRFRGALVYLERELRSRHFSPALHRLLPKRFRDFYRITIEKMFVDAKIKNADVAEILYGDRTKAQMIRDHCRKTKGLPQGWAGMLPHVPSLAFPPTPDEK